MIEFDGWAWRYPIHLCWPSSSPSRPVHCETHGAERTGATVPSWGFPSDSESGRVRLDVGVRPGQERRTSHLRLSQCVVFIVPPARRRTLGEDE